QGQLTEYVSAAQNANQRLRRPLLDHLEPAAAHDEHAVGRLACAHNPGACVHMHVIHLPGEAFEQLIRQARKDGHIAQEGNGAHWAAVRVATRSGITRWWAITLTTLLR